SIVMVTIAVLAVDLATTQGWITNPGPESTPAEIELGSPALNFPSLPSVLAPWLPGGDKRLVPLPQPDGIMAQPMTFELVSGGKSAGVGRRGGATRRRQGYDRRASGSGAPFGGQPPATRRNERCAKHLGALPALSRRYGRQPAGLGACHGDTAR